MNKKFHEHLVETQELEIELDSLDLSTDEKGHLLELAHSSFYHVALDTVLSEIPEEHKKTFLENLASKSHVEIWEHLNNIAQSLEEKIKEAIDGTKQSLLEDIKAAKRDKLAS